MEETNKCSNCGEVLSDEDQKIIDEGMGDCPGCLQKEEDEERKSYHDDGYAETSCQRCNTTQWMLRSKLMGTCCECGETLENQCYDELEDLKNQKNKINRKISTLKRAQGKDPKNSIEQLKAIINTGKKANDLQNCYINITSKDGTSGKYYCGGVVIMKGEKVKYVDNEQLEHLPIDTDLEVFGVEVEGDTICLLDIVKIEKAKQ